MQDVHFRDMAGKLLWVDSNSDYSPELGDTHERADTIMGGTEGMKAKTYKYYVRGFARANSCLHINLEKGEEVNG